MITSKKDAIKAGVLHRKIDQSAGAKSVHGYDLARQKRSTTERVSEAFATASKKTGVFQSHYAKKITVRSSSI